MKIKWIIAILSSVIVFHAFSGSFEVGERENRANYIPQPVFEADPDLIDLYYAAWDIAATKVKNQPGLPQTPYMDEGLWDDVIWIWDTCFMSLFCKYAPEAYPGVESLKNFYVTMHDEGKEESPLVVWHTDNPPLFSWVEYDNYLFSNDKEHLDQLVNKDKYLQQHYQWFNEVEKGWRYTGGPRNSAPVYLGQHKLGYTWNGIASGMDNTPRGRGPGQNRTLWVDALAQQGLSALYLSRLNGEIENIVESDKWMVEYNRIKELVNQYYWDEKDGFYYDIKKRNLKPVKVMTPASFWPVLAEMASEEQVARMVEQLENESTLGGNPPTVTLARDDKQFKANGSYWKGSVWLPTSYMTIKAIEKYGYDELANDLSMKIVKWMSETYINYEPHTIWECYSPTETEPAKNADGLGRCREDFCGWSALGPISLFIENILGFKVVDAQNKKVEWNIFYSGDIGIRNLRFGDIKSDIVRENGKITVISNKPFDLIINGELHEIESGEKIIN